jgi:LDH2 family malate/lactate/ureidoglycolate dehydrogenase
LPDQDVLVDPAELETLVSTVFAHVGMADDEAAYCARSLVQTDLWGKSSHGVMRLPHYVRRIQSGAVNPRPATRMLRGSRAFRVMDGDDGPGLLVGRDAMLGAIGLADEFDVGVVGVVRSSHFGAAALYARLAVDQGMAGIVMTNTAPKIVAPGGAKPITGSNPLAIGVPSYGAFPFVLDLSQSTVAGGKLLLAREKGERVPLGWAVDKDGEPTDDPATAFAGFWLPAGGVKGLGLSYAVDVLAGVVTGAAFGLGMKSQYAQEGEPSGTGHLMIALRLEAVIDRDDLRRRMRDFFSGVKASPMRDDADEMLLPGESAYRCECTRRDAGIPLPAGLYADLLALGRELGVDAALHPRATGT